VFVLVVSAANPNVIGTLIVMVGPAPAAIEQPVKLVAVAAGQPDSVPPVEVIAPLVLTPVGNASVNNMAAVVGKLVTAMVIV
jgi:hypothetical protein